MLWDGKDIFKTAVTIKPISSSSAFLPQQTSPIVERHKHLGEQERNTSQWVQRYRQKRAAWQEERAHERHLLSVSKSAGAVPLMNRTLQRKTNFKVLPPITQEVIMPSQPWSDCWERNKTCEVTGLPTHPGVRQQCMYCPDRCPLRCFPGFTHEEAIQKPVDVP